MALKISQLISIMERNNIKLPLEGTGRYKQIVARDLEKAIGDHFFAIKYTDQWEAKHCAMRRAITPMKSYRYNRLNEDLKWLVLESNDDEWVGEEKYNGWRIIVTHIPHSNPLKAYRFWGGNISDVDCLPKNYTEHIVIDDFNNTLNVPCYFDTEALCYDDVETLDGLISGNSLDAIGSILGSDPERAVALQQVEGATIDFKFFDCIIFDRTLQPMGLDTAFHKRRENLERIIEVANSHQSNWQTSELIRKNKKRFLQRLWKEGKEGMISKNLNAPYASGGRLKTHSVKIKRTMSGEIGDDIDVFVSGYELTPEHYKKGLIGGVSLSVLIRNDEELKEHKIATVTNMPDAMRSALTYAHDGIVELAPEYYHKVLVVDGQELSNRNRKLMHAKVDWDRGFRQDKSYLDCVIELQEFEEEKF